MNTTSRCFAWALASWCAAGCTSQPGSSAAPNGGSTASGGLSSAGSTSGSSGGPVSGNVGGSGLAAAGGSSSGDAGRSGDAGGSASGGAEAAVGGSAPGGAGAPGLPTLPEFVTSAANAYWNTTGQVTRLTSGTADLTVDEATKYQHWDGFGGCFNEMGWDALSVVSAEIPRAMKLLFDAKDGANFAYGRLPLGASDYAMSWYTLDDTAGDFTMDKFSIDRDKQKLIPFIQAALEV